MSAKRDQKSDRSKKPDKMTLEYLEMDTDEEDFGRQESPEIEEELPPEPEKPVFSEQDLITLVEYTKDLVTLPSIKDADWNEDCYKIIREYFQNPSHLVLTIYYNENKLIACLGIPDHASDGFTYFTRSPWQIYTVENFLTTVSFGSINQDVGSSVLKYMLHIYAPLVLNSNEDLPLKRNDLFLNLHKFLMCLTEEVYRPMGLTVLYVPRENLLQTFRGPSTKIDCFLLGEGKGRISNEEDESKRKLVDRLEEIVWFWIKQIRGVTKTMTIRKPVENILDEVHYWKATQSKLNYLHNQLLDTDVRLIIEILRNIRSPSVELLQKLSMQVERGLEESSSNLLYLNILSDSCKDLSIPEEVSASVTQVLLIILFIWTESPYYNTINNVEILCRMLSSQIINQCKNYIDLDIAFRANPQDGIMMIEKCINCCEIYKTIYDKLIADVVVHIELNKKWTINEEEIFNKIYTFKRRCYDVIDICKALIVFGKCNKVGSFGSPNGMEYEVYCRKIENSFCESLDRIIIVRDIIFDVSKAKWLKKISEFRNTLSELENMVKNLINDVFENVKNIDEGIEAIYALQKFKQRESLREILESKWTQVWKIFSDEIQFCFAHAINDLKTCDKTIRYKSVNESLLCILQYLKTQYTMLTDASEWIGECHAEKQDESCWKCIFRCIVEQYKRVLSAIDERRKVFET